MQFFYLCALCSALKGDIHKKTLKNYFVKNIYKNQQKLFDS